MLAALQKTVAARLEAGHTDPFWTSWHLTVPPCIAHAGAPTPTPSRSGRWPRRHPKPARAWAARPPCAAAPRDSCPLAPPRPRTLATCSGASSGSKRARGVRDMLNCARSARQIVDKGAPLRLHLDSLHLVCMPSCELNCMTFSSKRLHVQMECYEWYTPLPYCSKYSYASTHPLSWAAAAHSLSASARRASATPTSPRSAHCKQAAVPMVAVRR